MTIRDRIEGFRRVPARALLPHPKNWCVHSPAQRAALQGILAEIGYADALLVRETPDELQLIDGHLRAETTPDQMVPVLVLDLDEKEVEKLLASLDPLAAMAGKDDDGPDGSARRTGHRERRVEGALGGARAAGRWRARTNAGRRVRHGRGQRHRSVPAPRMRMAPRWAKDRRTQSGPVGNGDQREGN
jgi:hypothetical protein